MAVRPKAREDRPNILPIIATARETYAVILRNPGAFLAAAALPFVLYLADSYLSGFYYRAAASLFDLDSGGSGHAPLAAAVFLHSATWLFLLLAITLLGLAWHSFVVVGKNWPCRKTQRMSLGRWWRYFLWSALLLALTSILLGKAKAAMLQETALLFGDPSGARDVLLYRAQLFAANAIELIVAAFWIRFALVLPMAGLSGQRYGLRDSWRDTRGHGVRFLLIIGLVYLPYAGVIEALNWAYAYAFYGYHYGLEAALIADGTENPSLAMGVYEVLGALRGFLFMGLLLSLLSVLFLQLKGRDLALAELAEDQSRPPLRPRLAAALIRAKYWGQPK